MGFDMEKFVVGITDDKKCGLCFCVLDNPVRTPCDHVFCSGCILPWVVRHGKCPQRCQILTPNDLDNVLPLRKTILDLRVKCDFVDRGCDETVRLMDLVSHTQDCGYRPVGCGNSGCVITLSYRDMKAHEAAECLFRPVGICHKGCGQVLLENTRDSHDCLEALKSHINQQEVKIGSLNEDIKRISSKFEKREKGLVGQVTTLHTEIQVQALRFDQKLTECKHHLDRLTTENYVQCCDVQREEKTVIMLERDKTGSLGFNIMGGFTVPQENNNTKVADGIIVSRVTEGLPADNNGLKLYDRIIKVNGQDLSNSTHEEAVDAFRSAQEPIVVEVLRRANKNKMKSRSPTLVSIGTQTEEDFYCYNRPPTPPPSFYPQHVHGLYQPSSRRPVAFSPSAEMGLTDIEMSHNMEYDDPYFDDRHYEMEYEEIILTRTSAEEKLGLTLCYGSLEDEITDIFISEVDPCSIAGNDGRIREGDQLLQINNVDVHSRDQAIKLFSEQHADISLIVARPHLQCEDVYMENMVLDDLHMDLLEKHHHDNMQFMASMLARRHLDEEGGTTDTATTENSSNKQDKDSGVGRTDDSMKNDESSEQETFDADCITPPTNLKFRTECRLDKEEHHHSNESFTSNDPEYANNEISAEACDKFRKVLENRCGSSSSESSPRKQCMRKDSESSLERELSMLNHEMEEIQFECQEIVQAHLKEQSKMVKQESQKSPRIVPRMGTRLDYMKQMHAMDLSDFWIRKGELSNVKMGQQPSRPVLEKDKDVSTTSAYNTAESCRSTPLTLELNQASDEGDKGFKNSMLCLAVNVPSSSDTEKQTQTPTKARDYSSDDSGHGLGTLPTPKLCVKDSKMPEKVSMGESLQDLYMQYADVMYTNRANLEHTIAVQQKLFQQQIEQHRGGSQRSAAVTPSSSKDVGLSGNDASKSPNTNSDGAMEWVVKRRPDGTRYITRRPVRNKLLKERGKKIHEERLGMTTDDDAMSEMKTGRYWSKEDRKKHIERARDYRKKKELIQKERMETLKEAEEKKEVNIVELSHRKMMKHKNKKVLDNFVTVQEVLAHGSRVPEGKGGNPLLSVTTV